MIQHQVHVLNTSHLTNWDSLTIQNLRNKKSSITSPEASQEWTAIQTQASFHHLFWETTHLITRLPRHFKPVLDFMKSSALTNSVLDNSETSSTTSAQSSQTQDFATKKLTHSSEDSPKESLTTLHYWQNLTRRFHSAITGSAFRRHRSALHPQENMKRL